MEALPGWRLSVAPMMDWTDRHCRAFHRTLSRRARLYTEMLTADAVIHGPRARLLGFDAAEHLQIGIAAIGLLQSQDDTLHSRKLRSFDEPPFR